MPKLSAGILVYRGSQQQLEVFLVHPGGPFWAKKDKGAWSLPKGEYAEGETPWEAAKREFQEETGQPVPGGEPLELGQVKYGNKILTAWAIAGEMDASRVSSNMFSMEWPPRSGKTQEFPEVDRAGWFTPAVAQTKLVSGQVELVDRLLQKLGISQPQNDEPTQISLL
ncbi:MAG TPA: NUDIX domain-containing protein [Candidatus Saccharimonadales bacterium]|nr:NUDIX domain-containing protein [Candidatus Saccharimonadales bacterium]